MNHTIRATVVVLISAIASVIAVFFTKYPSLKKLQGAWDRILNLNPQQRIEELLEPLQAGYLEMFISVLIIGAICAVLYEMGCKLILDLQRKWKRRF